MSSEKCTICLLCGTLGTLLTGLKTAVLHREVANIIDHVKAVTGAHRVTLVGHSMGGLASRAAIQLFGHTSDVDKLITLGTPHQGSWLAALNQDTFLSLTGLPELAVLAGLNPSSPGVQSLAPSSPELSQINSAPIPSIPSMLHVSIVSIDRGAALAATAAVDAQAISCLSSVTPACLGLLSHLASLNVAIPNSDLLVTTDSQNLNSVFPAVGAIVDTSLAQIHVLETASVASVLLKYLGIAP